MVLYKNNIMIKLNKFEKRFVIVDLFSTGTIYGGLFILLKHKLNLFNLIIAIILMWYYYFRLRKGIWRTLEEKEHAEKFNLPDNFEKQVSIFDYLKTQKDIKDETPNLK